MTEDVFKIFEKVKEQNPLVHHLTNWVTIYDCANIVKVFGASPVMAHASQEVSDMVQIASAVVLNIGTLTDDFIESMIVAGQAANKKGIPIVLDVCGAGATAFRDSKCLKLLSSMHVDIIKGNSSEIARIAGEQVKTKGVDAVNVDKDVSEIARKLAASQKSIIVVTGKKDVISDGVETAFVNNGHEMMSCVVGTGCMAASVIGTFAAVEKDFIKAACAGLCCFEVAAELAAANSAGPASFKEKLFDEVYNLNKEKIYSLAKVQV